MQTPILLLYSCDVLSIKNICHACSVEKYGYVIYVHLIVVVCETFYTVLVYCVEHGKNMKSVV
jgi:hypothetical protein